MLSRPPLLVGETSPELHTVLKYDRSPQNVLHKMLLVHPTYMELQNCNPAQSTKQLETGIKD